MPVQTEMVVVVMLLGVVVVPSEGLRMFPRGQLQKG